MANRPCPTICDIEKKENMEKRRRELQITIEKQNDRVNHLQTSAFTLANYYFVFQGFLLGAIIAATSALRCSDRWFLFSLSLIAAIINLVSLLVIGGNYKSSIMQRHQNKSELNKLESDLGKLETFYLVNGKLETSASGQMLKSDILSYWDSTKIQASAPTQLQEVGSQDPTVIEIKDEPEQRLRHSSRVMPVDNQNKQLHNFYFLLCMGLFISFAIIVIVGCWTIPCKKALQSIPLISNVNGDKCIRLCQGSKCASICNEY